MGHFLEEYMEKGDNGNLVTCLEREWNEELNLSIDIKGLLSRSNCGLNKIRYFHPGKILDIWNIQLNEHDEIKFLTETEILDLNPDELFTPLKI